jgi:putative ABC transport system permease protein
MQLLKLETATTSRRKSGKLLSTQAALCVVLLAVALIFGRSLDSLRNVDKGFDSRGVLDAEIDLSLVAGTDESRAQLLDRIIDATRKLPRVESATLAGVVPLAGSNMETRVAPLDMVAASRFDYPMTYFNIVGSSYFSALKIPLVAGRAINDDDRAGTPRVAVINETAARRWWPSATSALGKRFHWGSVDGDIVEVVGIARDANYNMPGESPKAFVYMPLSQDQRSSMTMQLRTDRSIDNIRSDLWKLLREIAPTLPPPQVTTMDEDMSITVMPIRAGAILLATLGAIALLLAAAGINGVTAYSVERRTREIGIRAALGADRSRLVTLVLSESLRPIGYGLLFGAAVTSLIAFGLSRVMFGIHVVDPVVLMSVALVLVATSVLATILPAWRAASVDPSTAIRAE